MISTASIWAHLYLSVAAVLGLLILHQSLRADDPLTRRFVFGVRVTIALFAGRALVVLTAWGRKTQPFSWSTSGRTWSLMSIST